MKDIDVDGNDIKRILKMRWEGVEWIDLAQNTEIFRTLVSRVMRLCGSLKFGGDYLSSWGATSLSSWIPLRGVRYRLGPTGCGALGAGDSGPPV